MLSKNIYKFVKRIIDIVIASFAFIFLLPIFILTTLLIKIDSRGSIIFKQNRIGYKQRVFSIYKFRTMRQSTHYISKITTADDKRITPLGYFLRKHKIDELPQLLNIIIGDMSIIGPRPEVPDFLDSYTEDERQIIFSIRPGLSDLASLKFIDENELLKDQGDHEKFYIENILPEKKLLQIKYVRTMSALTDLEIAFKTLIMVLKKFLRDN